MTNKLIDGCSLAFAGGVMVLGLFWLLIAVAGCGALVYLVVRIAQSIGG